MAVPVNVENFVRAESDRLFAAFVADAGGVNRLKHNRAPTPIDEQTVIRMNRDTLYSAAVVDISEGATVTIPDGGGRYVSVMVVSQDHYVNRLFHEPGTHELRLADHETPWVVVAARILVDPSDAEQGFDHAFGARADVDPIRHLIGTAAGWGGLPDSEVRYVGVEPPQRGGAYRLTVRDVPVDGFWSIFCTTPTATSSRTTAAPTASTTSRRRGTTTAP